MEFAQPENDFNSSRTRILNTANMKAVTGHYPPQLLLIYILLLFSYHLLDFLNDLFSKGFCSKSLNATFIS